MSDSRPTWAFLGPEATFCEAALSRVPGADAVTRLPCASVDEALSRVRSGAADAAVVPIENSVEGGVGATLDALAVGEDLVIRHEVLLPVTFVLAVLPGTALADVRSVSTHPHAQAQCRGWLASALPGVGYVPASSTAGAAAALLDDDASAGSRAALCNPTAAERYGLAVLASDVGDRSDAVTRFVQVGRPSTPPPVTGSDKTTLVVHLPSERPGALLEMLDHFAARGINLTRIESRPRGDALGRYSFSIDADGHVLEERMAEALMGLHRSTDQVRFLGSYPRADGASVPVRPGTDDDAFGAARRWVRGLRG